MEGRADALAEGYISVVYGVEGYEAHFFDIGFAVGGKIVFIAYDVDYFGHKIKA